MITLINILASLLPVLIFLIVLIVMDSYKLLKIWMVMLTIIWGCVSAGVALLFNRFVFTFVPHQSIFVSVLVAPIIEETVKSVYPLWQLNKKKIGFLVDSAIIGFAVGTGFALVENLFFMQALGERSVFVWLIRGLGTAVMHGGTTGIMMIIVRYFTERRSHNPVLVIAAGLLTAMLIHAGFNYLIHVVSPEIILIMQLVILPTLLALTFTKSEKNLRNWLEEGLAANIELLGDIRAGRFRETKTGQYLYSLKEHLPGETLADIFCYLQIYLELSARAKALLILKELSLPPTPDPETPAKFSELKQLEKNIGKTGLIAMAPLIRTNPRDLWQLYFLAQQSNQE